MNNNLKIGFIGAGKVGFSLGKFFKEKQIHVTGYYSRHVESAAEAADFTGTDVYDGLEQLITDSDAIFLTVPDGVICQVFKELVTYDITDKMICHCSGALSARDAFPGIEATGATGYSIHPLFPISSKYDSFRELSDAFFCLEGNEYWLRNWQQLLEYCGAKTKIISGQSKTKYHCGCAIASNLVCALVHESISLLSECGFGEDEALAALAPLIVSNTRHIVAEGPVRALTGPVERGDISTVSKHLNCLDTEKERELYRAVSASLVDVAKSKNPMRDYNELSEILL